MERLLAIAAELGASAPRPDDLRVVGGVAMHLLVGPSSRTTLDLDLVAMTVEAAASVERALEARGFVVGASAGWIRASSKTERLIIDLSPHPIVHPRTFETFALRGEAVRVSGVSLPIASPDDLALMKLLAMRDQDAVDLMLLASAHSLSARTIAANAAADDIERTASGGAVRARHVLASGGLAESAQQLLGRAPATSDLAKLTRLLAELEREGL